MVKREELYALVDNSVEVVTKACKMQVDSDIKPILFIMAQIHALLAVFLKIYIGKEIKG